MDAAAELGRNPVSKHQIQPKYGDEQADAGRVRQSNPSRETKFSGANGDREIFIFPVQLTTCRIGNLTRLIHTLAICVTVPYRYFQHAHFIPRVGVGKRGAYLSVHGDLRRQHPFGTTLRFTGPVRADSRQ